MIQSLAKKNKYLSERYFENLLRSTKLTHDENYKIMKNLNLIE